MANPPVADHMIALTLPEALFGGASKIVKNDWTISLPDFKIQHNGTLIEVKEKGFAQTVTQTKAKVVLDGHEIVIPEPAGIITVLQGKVYRNGELFWERHPAKETAPEKPSKKKSKTKKTVPKPRPSITKAPHSSTRRPSP